MRVYWAEVRVRCPPREERSTLASTQGPPPTNAVCTQPTRKRGCPLDGLYRADTTSRRASHTHDIRGLKKAHPFRTLCVGRLASDLTSALAV